MPLVCRQLQEKISPQTIILTAPLPGSDMVEVRDLDHSIEKLMPELQRRKDSLTEDGLDEKEYPYLAVLIPDLKETFERASNDTMRRLSSIVVLGERLHIIVIAQGRSEDIGLLYNAGDNFTNNMVKQASALIIGGTPAQHSAFPIDLLYTEKSAELGNELGYFLSGNKLVKIKMIQQ